MSDTATPTVLEGLEEQHQELGREWDEAIEAREAVIAEFEKRTAAEKEDDQPTVEERDAHAAEEEAFRKVSGEFDRRGKELEARIGVLRGREERRSQGPSPKVDVVSEPATYRQDNADDYSYFKDLLATHPVSRDAAPRGAGERILRHKKETEERLEREEQHEKRAAEQKIDQAEREFRKSFGLEGGLSQNPFERRVAPSRETGHGGEFVPPKWEVDQWIPALRGERVISPLCRNLPVPPGTDVVKVPKMKVGTEVGPQLADNAAVASRDVETTSIEAPIKTLAGQEDYAIQVVDQSPNRVFQQMVQQDILADYNLKVEQNVSFGQGVNFTTLNAGTIRGLFPTANWGAGHRESSEAISPQRLVAAMGANWSWLAKERFSTEGVHHVINPAFGAFLGSATDLGSETGRLFVNSEGFPSLNVAGLESSDTEAQGFFMRTPLGPNVYISPNIPPILPQGTSTEAAASILFAADKKAEKVITSGSEAFSYCLTAKWDDVWFFESNLRTRVLPEVLSGTLQIRYQVYNYIGLLVRYGPSLQFAGGTPFKVGTSFGAAPTEPKLGGYAY